MKAVMAMTVDTTWGNAVTCSVESELDNDHSLTTAELARLQVYTLSVMIAEVRRENERVLNIAHEDREHERFGEMERSRDPRDAKPTTTEREVR